MGRDRSRSYSPRRRSRTPPPRERKRHHEDDHRRDHRDQRSSGPTGLLVRNLPLNARNEDLRIPFERYGPVKDVYLPKDFHTGKPRGFGFVKFRDASDAAEAKHQLNDYIIGGREIRIVYAEENRKTPQEMSFSRPSGGYGGSHRRRSPMRSPRRRYHSSSRTPSPARFRDRRYRDDDHHSPVRSRSTSRSPQNEKRRSVSRSPRCRDYGESQSPRADNRTRADERVRSPSMSRSPRVVDQNRSRFHSRSHSSPAR